MSTRWKALVAAAAVVATPVLVTVPLGGTAHAAVKHETTISIRSNDKRVDPGESSKVRGNLNIKRSDAEPGKVVTLEARPDGTDSFTAVGTSVAGDHGGIQLTVTPQVTTKYRWYYPGDDTTRASRSGVVRIVVGPKQGDGDGPNRLKTTLSIRATDRPVDADGDSLVRGKLMARGIDIPNREVLLLSRTQGQEFAVVAMQRTDRDGVVKFPVSPTVKTAYRLKFEGTQLLRPSHSGVVRVGVRPVVTASATPTTIDPGEVTTISGAVSYEGAPYVGATVDLVARNAKHRHAKFAVLATGTTDAAGAVSFDQSPSRTTVYRLVVRHSEGTPPRAVSDTVRVRVTQPSSLSIRGRTVNDTYKVSGVLRGGGSTLSGRVVTLEKLAEDGVTWTAMGTDTTGRHGKAEFTQELSVGSSYRLSYAGGPQFAPCVSGVVVN